MTNLTDREREALERLRRHEMTAAVVYPPNGDHELSRDWARLARAMLRLFPADDETPWNEDWLRSVGFYATAGGGYRIDAERKGLYDHLRHTAIFVDENWNWWANGLGCANCKTRGDVRRLCEGLGIELKEQNQ